MIHIKTSEEILYIRRSCKIVSKVLKKIRKAARPGTTTEYLNLLAEEIIANEGATPGFKGFNGYPYTLCTSINDIALHGFPDKTELRDGDLLKVDVGVLKDGYYGDAAITVPIGNISTEDNRLMRCTKKALYNAIKVAKNGVPLNYVSYVIQRTIEERGFNVIKSYGGHGIGRELHEEPFVKNFTMNKNRGPLLKANMTICIEPVATIGEDLEITHRNGWSICMKDGAKTAHFEHTILITDGEAEILTKN